MIKPKTVYIFDFDSTFIQVESLEELAKIALNSHPERENIFRQIQKLTELTMSGRYSYQESLSERFELLSLSKNHITKTIEILQNKITPSIVRNLDFFKQYAQNIYLVSGAFFDIVWPIVKPFGILQENVMANRLLYDCEGNIIDFVRTNPLSQDQGKVKLIQQLNLNGPTVLIGDGYNDYEVKEAQLVDTFIAFTENISRKEVVEKADAVIDNLEGLFITCNLPFFALNNRPKVLLLESIHPSVIQYFNENGYEVIAHYGSLSEQELIDEMKDIQLLGIRSKTRITKNVLKSANHLTAVGAFCIGTNQIDIDFATECGISVFNAPFSNTRSVVELTMAEIIMLMRGIPEANMTLHQGIWNKSSSGSHEVRGKTIGIIGYGKIGSQLSILAESLGMQVKFYDLEEKLPLGNAIPTSSLHECVKNADVVSLHVDGRPENKNLINSEIFELMKKNVVFLNLSRDHCVDYDALAENLQSKKIKGAAIDVFPNEPLNNPCEFKSKLQMYSNTLLTPHIGGSTEEAQHHIGQCVFNYLNAYFKEGSSSGSLNIPALSLSTAKSHSRILHIHKNVPGILAKINKILSEHQCNVEGQFLKTNQHIGYVITDVNHPLSEESIDALGKIEHTIKVRVLNNLVN